MDTIHYFLLEGLVKISHSSLFTLSCFYILNYYCLLIG